MKKNIKRSIFSVALCAMLVFCVGFYSSAEPTTAWFSDTGTEEKIFNMDEISIEFVGDGITGDAGNQSSEVIELNFKSATKADDEENDGDPDPMFEYAAEFYMFKATNNSAVSAKLNVDISTESEYVKYRVYELGSQVTDENITAFLTAEKTTAETTTVATTVAETTTATDTVANWQDVYVDSFGNRVLKLGDSYYDANLTEKLSATDESLLLNSGDTQTYCIALWAEYSEFDTEASTVQTITCNADIKISAEQYVADDTE